MTPRPSECTVCGFPNLRPEGHAEWCERVTVLLLAPETSAPCGTYASYGRGCRCERCTTANREYQRAWRAKHRLTFASVAAPSFGSATGVEGAATNGAVGRSGDLVGEVKAAAPAAPTTRSEAHTGASLTNNAAR